MTMLRAQKIAGIADDIPPLEAFGPQNGDLLDPRMGLDVWRNPQRRRSAAGRGLERRSCPSASPESIPEEHRDRPAQLQAVLVPEVNLGQLSMLLRAKFLIDIKGFNRVRGKPFRIIEIKQAAEELLGEK